MRTRSNKLKSNHIGSHPSLVRKRLIPKVTGNQATNEQHEKKSKEDSGNPVIPMSGTRGFVDKKADENEMLLLPDNPAGGQVVSFEYKNSDGSTTISRYTYIYSGQNKEGKWEKNVNKSNQGNWAEPRYVSQDQVNQLKSLTKVESKPQETNDGRLRDTEVKTGKEVNKNNSENKNKSIPPVINGISVKEGEKISFDINVNFENWNATIINLNEIKPKLDDIVHALKKDSSLHIWLSGLGMGSDTDVSPKNPKYTSNMCLYDRAKALKTELLKRGANTNQITIGPPKTIGRRGVEVTVRNLSE